MPSSDFKLLSDIFRNNETIALRPWQNVGLLSSFHNHLAMASYLRTESNAIEAEDAEEAEEETPNKDYSIEKGEEGEAPKKGVEYSVVRDPYDFRLSRRRKSVEDEK